MTALTGASTLVTGGAGTIGSTIVDQLLAAGVGRIRILDNLVRGRRANLAAALEDPRVELVVGDLRDIDLVHDMTKGSDLVFHEAAIRITQCAEEPRLALQVLVDGTFTVLEAAAEHKIDKIVAASSASVYGLAEEFPTTERHHHHNNDTFYGAAKSFNEGMLRSFRAMYGLDYVALRPFNVYGPRMDIHGVYTEVLIRWMERISCGSVPADLRRRSADDGLRQHGRHCQGPSAGRVLGHPRGRLQRRQRHRNQPGRPGQSTAAGDGFGPAAGARTGAGGQRRDPPARLHRSRGPGPGLPGRDRPRDRSA